MNGEELEQLNAAGYTYADIAKVHGLTRGKVASRIRQHRLKSEKRRSKFYVEFPEYWQLSGDWMVCGDVHVPCSDYDFAQLLVKVAKQHNIKRLLVGGDFFTFDIFSSYPKDIVDVMWRQERDAGRTLIGEWLEWFDEIRFIMGNHDRRMVKWVNGQFDSRDIFSMVTSSDKCHFSDWGHCMIDTASGPWRVTHSKNYSVNQLTVADTLAQKFQCNVISHHEHHLAHGWDRFKRYVVINNGGLFDQAKMAYVVLDDSKMPNMTPGFTRLENGVAHTYGKHPYTDWQEVLHN
jgi:hypothetical protein